MNCAYKYKLYPSKSQEQLLNQIAGSTRWVWNHMLALQKTKYETEKKFNFAVEMANLLPQLKQQPETQWLKLSPSQSLQQVCIDQDRALNAVWKSKFGFPKFKSKHKSKDSFRIPQTNNHIKISDTHITIPKIGLVKWRYHRPITGKIKSITISKDISDWYVSVLVEIPDIEKITEIDKTKTLGIDLGISSFATLSDGTKIDSPNFLKNKLYKLKKYQRRVKNKTKGSANIKKAYVRIARIHRDIRNSRLNWLHQQSRKLVDTYDVICVEDLKIQELLKKKQLSRSIADQGWGIFLSQLKYKTELAGKYLTKINTYLPSTKACSSCGNTRIMKLSDRVYICENEICTDYLKAKDRDLNAAINIHIWGLMATKIVLNTPGIGEIKACGDTSTQTDLVYTRSLEVSVKQEARGSLVHG